MNEETNNVSIREKATAEAEKWLEIHGGSVKYYPRMDNGQYPEMMADFAIFYAATAQRREKAMEAIKRLLDAIDETTASPTVNDLATTVSTILDQRDEVDGLKDEKALVVAERALIGIAQPALGGKHQQYAAQQALEQIKAIRGEK